MRKLIEVKVLIVIYNVGKLEEFCVMLVLYGIQVISVGEMNLFEFVEIEIIFIGNVCIKVCVVMQVMGLLVLVDDSGIMVDGLDGVLGVYIVDWVEILNGCDFMQVMCCIWFEFDVCNVVQLCIVQFCVMLILMWFDGYEEIFEGVVFGWLVWLLCGDYGYGYDLMFIFDGYDMIFVEMIVEQKNCISYCVDVFYKLEVVFVQDFDWFIF